MRICVNVIRCVRVLFYQYKRNHTKNDKSYYTFQKNDLKGTMECTFKKFSLPEIIVTFMTVFTITNAFRVNHSANMSDAMCEPPVLVFYSMTVGSTNVIISIGGLNVTSPLFGVEGNGDSWASKWVNISREDPEIQFLLEQDKNVNLMYAYFGNVPDLVGLRYECPLTKENFTCVVKFMLNSDKITLTESTPEPSTHSEIIEGVTKWLNIDILKNNSDTLVGRWAPVCTAIANVSDPEHMSVSSQNGGGWFTCNATTPSPTRFWLKVNDSSTIVETNSTYTKMNETGWAFLNVSTNGTNHSCSAESILGWTVIANQSETVYETPQVAKLIGVPGSRGSRERNDGQNRDFFVILIIIVLLILAVVYLFFKNQVHVWLIKNVLSRFGANNKPSPSSRVEFKPVI